MGRKKRPRTGVPPPDEAAAAAAKTDSNELEEQVLIRFPSQVGNRISELISDESTGRCNLRNKLTCTFDQDLRHCTITLEDKQLYGRIYDLPTIIETMKTFDKVTMYKSCEVGQMIVCKEQPWDSISDDIKATVKPSFPSHRDDKYTKLFAFKHGC